MKVSKEDLCHIANLAKLNIKQDEIDEYLNNLEDILNFADVVNEIPLEDENEILNDENYNVYREDKIVKFDNVEGLLENAPEKERKMFKIPKVIEN